MLDSINAVRFLEGLVPKTLTCKINQSVILPYEKALSQGQGTLTSTSTTSSWSTGSSRIMQKIPG